MTETPNCEGLSAPAREILAAFSGRGAMFPQELAKAANLLPGYVELGLAELVSHGLVTCDSFGAMRQMITPPSRRKRPVKAAGRWSLFRLSEPGSLPRSLANGESSRGTPADELVARQLLRRTGVVFRRTITRERMPVSWSALSRIYRVMELRGEVRGGRFVGGFAGEQFALPEAVETLRRLRRDGPRMPLSVLSADPLNFQGILTPEDRVAPTTRRQVQLG
jgi:ATP-dependent Lhr-like helicase